MQAQNYVNHRVLYNRFGNCGVVVNVCDNRPDPVLVAFLSSWKTSGLRQTCVPSNNGAIRGIILQRSRIENTHFTLVYQLDSSILNGISLLESQ